MAVMDMCLSCSFYIELASCSRFQIGWNWIPTENVSVSRSSWFEWK